MPTPIPAPTRGPFGEAVLATGTVVFLVAAVIEFAFLLHYIVVAPAFKSWIGWMFVLRSLSFLLAGVAIVLGRVWGPFYVGRPEVTLVLFALVLVSSVTTYGTFLYERHRGGRDSDYEQVSLFARLQRVFRHGAKPSANTEPARSTGPLPIVKDA